MKILPWTIAVAMLALVACSPTQNAVVDAAEAVVEQRVDNIVVRGVNRMCKAPIDVVMRAAASFPGLIAFAVASCPETYGALRSMLVAQKADAAGAATIVVDVDDLRRILAGDPGAP